MFFLDHFREIFTEPPCIPQRLIIQASRSQQKIPQTLNTLPRPRQYSESDTLLPEKVQQALHSRPGSRSFNRIEFSSDPFKSEENHCSDGQNLENTDFHHRPLSTIMSGKVVEPKPISARLNSTPPSNTLLSGYSPLKKSPQNVFIEFHLSPS